jgi:hypothetical protein
MINEIVEAFDDHFSAELNKLKAASGGSKQVAAAMRKDCFQKQAHQKASRCAVQLHSC